MGALIFYLGFRLLQIEKKKEKTAEEETEKKKAPAGPSGISPVVPLDALSLELGYALIPLVDEEKGGDLRERVGRIRRELGLDLGLVLPPIKMIDNSILEPNEYCFKIRGVEVGRATFV